MNLTNKEELEKQKVRDLMKIATSLGVKGAWDMKKNDVIVAIIKANENVTKDKDYYIEHVQVSTLIAFRVSGKKAKSGKVIKKSTKNRRVMVETEYGAQFIVPFEDIIWVKTGKRWPKGVYKMLKGEGCIEDEE